MLNPETTYIRLPPIQLHLFPLKTTITQKPNLFCFRNIIKLKNILESPLTRRDEDNLSHLPRVSNPIFERTQISYLDWTVPPSPHQALFEELWISEHPPSTHPEPRPTSLSLFFPLLTTFAKDLPLGELLFHYHPPKDGHAPWMTVPSWTPGQHQFPSV